MSATTCDNCGAPYQAGDVFCEQCGYDFLTGSVPDPSGEPTGDPRSTEGEAVSGSTEGEADVALGENVSPVPGEDGTGAGPDPEGQDVARQEDGVAGASSNQPGPEAESIPSVFAPERDSDLEAEAPSIVLEISADRLYFDDVVSDGEVDFPDPGPVPQRVELIGYELHIGRTSESRAIHPDIDLAEMTGDQAVSSRHALIRLDDKGNATLVDIGSTNGTLVGDLDSEPLVEGVPVAFDVGQTAYVGAWTKLLRIS